MVGVHADLRDTGGIYMPMNGLFFCLIDLGLGLGLRAEAETLLTLLEPQSRFGDEPLENFSELSPKWGLQF